MCEFLRRGTHGEIHGMNRVWTGEANLDRLVGGLFPGRAALVVGPRHSGKTTLCLRYLAAGVAAGERVVLVSTEPVGLLIEQAEAAGLDLHGALKAGQLGLVTPVGSAPLVTRETVGDAFLRVKEAAVSVGASRLAFDNTAAWLLVRTREEAARQVFSLVRALERLNLTPLMTVAEPASAGSRALVSLLQSNVPIAMALSAPEREGDVPSARALKVLGSVTPRGSVKLDTFPPRIVEAAIQRKAG